MTQRPGESAAERPGQAAPPWSAWRDGNAAANATPPAEAADHPVAPERLERRALGLGTLRSRIFLAFLALGVTLLGTLALGMGVLLRDLHREAATRALADIAVPIAGQARVRLGTFLGGDEGTLSPRAMQQLRGIERPGDVSIFLLADDGRIVDVDPTAGPELPPRLDLREGVPGGQLTRGAMRLPGGIEHTYVATTLFGDQAPGGARALVVSRQDDSLARTVADVGRAVLAGGLALLLIGVPLAWLLARSVTRPLERLAHAAGSTARGGLPGPMPVSGPDETRNAGRSFNALVGEVAGTRAAQAELLAGLRHDLRATAAAAPLVTGLDVLEGLLGEAGRLRLEPLDGTAIVRAAVARSAAKAAARGQRLSGAVPADPLPFSADRMAVERIVDSLVEDALAAAPDGTGHVTIEARSLPGGDAMLAVRDDGPPIPSGTMSRVFERFDGVDGPARGAGSGVRLAIVQQLARAHGGRAFAENLEGGGARVGVTLPASPPSERG